MNTQPRAGLRIGVMPAPGPIRIGPDPEVRFLEIRDESGVSLGVQRCRWDACPECEGWFQAGHPGQIGRGAIVAACAAFDRLPRRLGLVRGTVTVREIVRDRVVFMDGVRPGETRQVDPRVRVVCTPQGQQTETCLVAVEFEAGPGPRFVVISEMRERDQEHRLLVIGPEADARTRPYAACRVGASLRVQVVDETRERVVPFEFANIPLCGGPVDEVPR